MTSTPPVPPPVDPVQLRRDLGLTPAQFARLVGVTLIVTSHAIVRFRGRIRPDMAWEEARLALAEAATRSVPLSATTRTGEEIWFVEEPRMLLIVKEDTHAVPSRGKVVVTVLGPEEYVPTGCPTEGQ